MRQELTLQQQPNELSSLLTFIPIGIALVFLYKAIQVGLRHLQERRGKDKPANNR